jgi:molybdenum cofactor biosynthesis enzyme MoaA
MSPETFRKAIDIAANYGEEYIVLGGGEPTLHLRFWEFLGLGLSIGHIWLATNGSITDTAIRLADMAKRGVIGCALSRDIYHDSIDDRVVEAFTKNKRPIGMDTFRDTDPERYREGNKGRTM